MLQCQNRLTTRSTFVRPKPASYFRSGVPRRRKCSFLRRCGPEFCQLSGNDDMALAFNAMGGVGCISVTANVAPAMCAAFQTACQAGNYAQALTLHDRLFALHTALFSDASPGPVKYALGRMRSGFPTELRLPMTEPGEASRAAVDAALVLAGLV